MKRSEQNIYAQAGRELQIMKLQKILFTSMIGIGLASCGTTNAPTSPTLRCPTPSTMPSMKVMYNTELDRELLKNSDYIESIIHHGSNRNLAQLERWANSKELSRKVPRSTKEAIRSARQYRAKNQCPDIPDYQPIIATDVVFDSVLPSSTTQEPLK